MNRGMIYKTIFIVFLIAFAVVLILPTVGEREMNIILKEDVSSEQIAALNSRFPSDNYQIGRSADSFLVKGYGLNDAVMNEIRTFPGVKDVKFVQHWAERKPISAKRINLGLDLQGGMQLVLMPNFASIERRLGRKLTNEEKTGSAQQALELLRGRIDQFGVSEPSLRKRESGAIEIQLPGVRDPEGVKRLIGTTGRVEYRIVNEAYTKAAEEWFKDKPDYKEKGLPTGKKELFELSKKISEDITLPDNLEIMFFYSRVKNTKRIVPTTPMVLEKKLSLAGDDIKKAYRGFDDYGRLAVHFATTTEGAAKFAEATSKKNHGKRLAISIDSKVRSAPSMNVQISTGNAIIQGDFTQEEVDTLISIIKEGALPVDLEKIEERSVGPSMGVGSINSGIKALTAALIAVMIFMVIYYKLSGIISALGLVLNLVFMVSILSWLNFTLTLPGIAGFVLTIGFAVDANVIIYERIKEELANGKSVRLAVSSGFDRAFWTIFDANVTTLIAAFILSQFGTGPIKGFAVTLSIGVITSMFVALYITKFIFELITMKKDIQKLSI
ncbi:MAG TPA: protein translocase subunit SecD [Spirochaetota bacterium]|nr:protein translocase subunit SecD [Spirochaetota bacterium]HPQ53001.1 protein translocase subunit SecD [Spirochaetota bacterium]